ncbi:MULTISPECIES: hypothetical protein [Amycolatopsis]|uniref:Uncharacterized protein n=1 Tax=Amycolatopsis dongchuanensis TaxID=1070866 RepID=A0ABP9R992_9PSEU
MAPDDSQAKRRYELLEPDRHVQTESLRQRMAELSADSELGRFETMLEEWSQSEWAHYGNPVSAMVETVTDQIKGAMADLGADPARLATVHVGTTLADDVSAQMQPFSDGSGLVTVADSIFSLMTVFAGYAGSALHRVGDGPAPKKLWRLLVAMRRGALGEDPAVLTGLLRYYNVNQRVYGLAAKLDRRSGAGAEQVASLIALLGAQFVIGHEVAHHVLGHDSGPSGFFPGEHLPVCSAEQQPELDADLLAYRAVVRVSEREMAGTPAASAGGVFALLGALVAMVTIHVTERALFVRRGCTHPPAGVRADLLVERVDQRSQQFVRLLFRNLLAAAEDSSEFGPGARVFDGDDFGKLAEISTPVSPEYLRSITAFDLFLCRPPDFLAGELGRIAEEDGAGFLATGGEAMAAGDLATALRLWGVDDGTAALVLDPRRALTFHSLLEAVRDGVLRQGVPKDRARTVAMIIARLTEVSLKDADR